MPRSFQPHLSDVDGRLFRPVTARDHALVRAAQPDFWQWLDHVTPAGGCTRPIRLAGADLHRRRRHRADPRQPHDTADMPDGVIYKACGNRRAIRLPVLRRGLPARRLPAHPRRPRRRQRRPRDRRHPPGRVRHPHRPRLRPGPHPARHRAHLRRPAPLRLPAPALPPRPRRATCPHGQPIGVLRPPRRADDPVLGQPLCLDCYDHDRPGRVEPPRRRTVAAHHHGHRPRAIRRTAKRTRHRPGHGQGRLRQGRRDATPRRRPLPRPHPPRRRRPRRPDRDPAPAGRLGARRPGRRRRARRRAPPCSPPPPHPAKPAGWLIAWGSQLDIRTISLGTDGAITDGMVAGYLAKYATKATEATGHTSRRLTGDTIDLYADPDGSHTERLVDACWHPRHAPSDWQRAAPVGAHARLRRPLPHQEPPLLRHLPAPARGPRRLATHPHRRPRTRPSRPKQPTVLVVNFLDFVGAGWHTTGDALLANTAAAMAREQRRTAREELTTASAN